MKIIVTSRTPLRVAGEYEYRVPLLPLPNEGTSLALDRLANLGSVQLFVERARSAKADFALTRDNAPAIAETCQRLDGLPLAIELAAARVRVLPPQKMLHQLDDRLKFLTSAARDLPSRQQTLRGAIGWSYDLLTPPEKLLFRRLAVFIGGATLEAIDYVCNISQDLDLLTGLESLLDKSLIRQTEYESDVRYDMLGTIRDFADEALVASGEAVQIQGRHLLYFHELAHDAEPNLVGPDELKWMMRLTGEHDNLQAALLWGLEHDPEKAVEILCDLALFWSRGGHNDEAIRWLQLALSTPVLADGASASGLDLKLRARALLSLGILSLQQDDSNAAAILQESIVLLRQLGEKTDLAVALAFMGFLGDRRAAEESVAIARTVANKWILAYCLAWQSQALRLTGSDLPLARRSATESTKLAREIGSEWAVARSVLSQGQLAVALGEFTEARSHLQECLVLFSKSQDQYHTNLARNALADVERWQGNYEEALKLYQAAILIWQDLGLRAAIARQLECITLVAAAQGHLQDAVRLAGAAQKLREQTGTQQMPNEQVEFHQSLEAVQRQLQESLYISLLAEGQAMTMSEAIAYTLALPDRPK